MTKPRVVVSNYNTLGYVVIRPKLDPIWLKLSLTKPFFSPICLVGSAILSPETNTVLVGGRN